MLQFRNSAASLHQWSGFQIAPNRLSAKLILSPEANSKHLRIVFITFIFSIVASSKKIVSSAYCKILTGSLFFPTRKLLNRFLSTASLIKPVRPSATMLNNSGARGSPCRRPLCGENSLIGLSLTKIDTDAEWRQPLIQCC